MIEDPQTIYKVLSGLLFAMALGGVFLCREFLKKIIAVNMMGAAVFLLLVSIAYRDKGEFPDPVPHAMVITGLVVAVSASALAVGLARRIKIRTGRGTFKGEGAE